MNRYLSMFKVFLFKKRNAFVITAAVKSSELSLEEKEAFTMGRAIKFFENDEPLDDRPAEPLFYTTADIQKAVELTSLYELGHYGGVDTRVYLALERYSIKNSKVGIIGSADQGYGPWYECMVLSQGGIPTVIEYNKISYEEDFITCISPAEMQVRVDSGFKFDALMCISSIEHDGLNRYGDPLNPNGDLASMKILKSYLKKDGLLYLSCPVGIDSVVWNWHRIYGEKRLPLLFSGWTLVDSFGFSDSHLQRNMQKGWKEKLPNGFPMFPNYPCFEPLFVLKNDELGSVAC